MRNYFLTGLLILAFAGISMAQTPAEDGWLTIFDGKTMSGWRFFKNRDCNSWEIKEEALHCKPGKAAEKRADIITTHKYKDFELSIQWKIAKGSNSGIMYHVGEKLGAPYLTGPEYQLIDDRGYPDPLTPLQKTGADYDMTAAGNSPIKPAGEWNITKIVVKGHHIEHWLNGTKLFEFEQFSDDWLDRKQKSKWKDEKFYGALSKGFICLQDHGDEVWFKDIRLRKL